jgi:nucleoside-diphosphate-sugar epimerase
MGVFENKMKVLVLGGTGPMGVHLAHILSGSGIETVITSRTQHEETQRVKYIQGNAQDIDFLNKILREHWDAVVDFMLYTSADFNERVNLLLSATSQYIFLSSARVYGNSEQPIVETSIRLLDCSQDREYLATDEYALAKARQEDVLRHSGHTNWTVLRPYITYSEDRLQLGVLEKEEWLYRALHGKTIVFSDDINFKKTTMTYGFDVAKGIAAIIGNTEALGETFHITLNEEGITWRDILNIYMPVLEKYLGYKPKVLLQDLDTFLQVRPNKYQVLYDRMYDRIFDNAKIARYVDIRGFVKPETGLRQCLEMFLKTPQFKHVDWGIMGSMDRQTGETSSLREIPRFKQKVKYLLYRYGVMHY